MFMGYNRARSCRLRGIPVAGAPTMAITNIAELKSNLSDVLRRVARGEEVIIAKRNVPFATIVPLPRRGTNRTRLGCLAHSVTVAGDLTDPAMPDSDWDMLDR
jgi:prevent-host-death family protein